MLCVNSCPWTPLSKRPWNRSALLSKGLGTNVSLAITLAGFLGAAYVFARVQVLQSYPFYNGVFGNEQLAFGITYTEALELFAAMAGTGLFARTYLRTSGTRKTRALKALGGTILAVGLIIAPLVYVETRLLWGEILPGVHIWQGFPGGGGYPWGGEQVAYNTCLVQSGTAGDCLFLNYDELFWLAVFAVVIGYVLKNLDSPSIELNSIELDTRLQ
jgi:hypothetical protein